MARRKSSSLATLSQPGLVEPHEYDWERQFLSLADLHRSGMQFAELDLGKVLGLARAYARIIAANSKPLMKNLPKGGVSVDADTKL